MGGKPWDTFQPDLNSANVAQTSGIAWSVCQVSPRRPCLPWEQRGVDGVWEGQLWGTRGLRPGEERGTLCLLFVAHKGPSPAQTLQTPRVSSTKLRELRFSSQDLWERCLGGGRKEGPWLLFGLISCYYHLKKFSVLPVSAKTTWFPCSSDFRPQIFHLASTLLLLLLTL